MAVGRRSKGGLCAVEGEQIGSEVWSEVGQSPAEAVSISPRVGQGLQGTSRTGRCECGARACAGALGVRVRGASDLSLGALLARVDAELHVEQEAAELHVQLVHEESGLCTRVGAGTLLPSARAAEGRRR